MPKSYILKFVIIRSIGNFLLLFAIFGVIATFGPALYYEIGYRITQARGIEYAIADESTPLGDLLEDTRDINQSPGAFANLLSGEKKQILVPPDTDFSIVIPKIGASSRVIPNVNVENEDVFQPALKLGVAHAEGTVFPGIPGNTYLFAHSTDNFWDVGRYNAVFYLIKDLAPGDEIVVFFQNVRHNYVVQESKIVDADDVSAITGSRTGEETLILQTCWPPGTTWKRLLVIAKPQ